MAVLECEKGQQNGSREGELSRSPAGFRIT
jgi:hypothetical protein